MAIILPKEGSIYETLGAGLGSGLQALAQGKVQQMQKRNYASSLQQMGLSPDIAYLPEPLQKIAMEQHFSGLSALQKGNQLSQGYNALLDQAKKLGLNEEFIETIKAAGPQAGSEMLKGIIRDLQKPDKAQNWLQSIGLMDPTGKSVYKAPKNTSGVVALNAKYGQGTPESYLENPMVTAEEKDALRRNMAFEKAKEEGSYGLTTIPGVLGNVISGLTQAAGTGLGLTGLASLISPGEGTIQDREKIAAVENRKLNKNRYEDILKTADPESKEYKGAQQVLDYYKRGEDLQKKEDYEKETRTGAYKDIPSVATVKENVINPIAQIFGLEKYVQPRNLVESVAERFARVAPATMLSAIGRGTEVGIELIKSLGLPLSAESIGAMTKKFTGSDKLDGAATLASYLLGAYTPEAFNKAIKKGTGLFKNKIINIPKEKTDASQLLEGVQPIVESINTLPDTKGSVFLKKQIDAINRSVNTIDPRVAAKAGIPSQSITPHKAFELDQLLSGEVADAARSIGSETAESLDTIRNSLRSVWEPYFMDKAPELTKGMIDSIDAKKLLGFNDKIQDVLEGISKAKTPLFNVPGHIAKAAAKLLKPTRKFFIQIGKSPILREATFEAVSEAAKNNASGVLNALEKISKNR